MDTIYRSLFIEAKRLAALIQLIFAGQAYSASAFARQLSALESNLSQWLIRQAISFCARLKPQALRQPARPSAPRSPSTPRTAEPARASRPYGFRVIGLPPQPKRPTPAAIDTLRTPRAVPGFLRLIAKHEPLLRRLGAARQVLNNPSHLIARLARKLRPLLRDDRATRALVRPYTEECRALAAQIAQPSPAPFRPDS